MSGLPPRPEVPAGVRAAVQFAVDHAYRQRSRPAGQLATWRFSGRWFSAHPIRTRARPG